MDTYMQAYTHAYTCTHAWTVPSYAGMYVCTFMCMHTCTWKYLYKNSYAFMQPHTHRDSLNTFTFSLTELSFWNIFCGFVSIDSELDPGTEGRAISCTACADASCDGWEKQHEVWTHPSRQRRFHTELCTPGTLFFVVLTPSPSGLGCMSWGDVATQTVIRLFSVPTASTMLFFLQWRWTSEWFKM